MKLDPEVIALYARLAGQLRRCTELLLAEEDLTDRERRQAQRLLHHLEGELWTVAKLKLTELDGRHE